MVIIYQPRRDGRLSWPRVAGWLHTEIDVRHRELNPTRSPISVLTGSDVLTSLIKANVLTTTPDHQPIVPYYQVASSFTFLQQILPYTDVDGLNSCWPTAYFHNQHSLWIWSELYTIIERRAKINGHFQCSVVSLNLCKECLNMAIFKITILLPIKSWRFWCRAVSYVVICRSYEYEVLKMVQFLAHPLP